MSADGRVEILTDRFRLRELTLGDVTDRYLAWLDDGDARKYIAAAKTANDLATLRRFVAERSNRDDVLFLGIFGKATGLHIGNIKFEPVDHVRSYAVMGILIGDPDFRGKGVTAEVLTATGWWLHQRLHIDQIVLGVHRDNHRAIRAYEKVGFVVETTPFIPETADTTTMVWRLPKAQTSR
jgi:ribosomal-protein-alanine N-acetyltransferase